MSVVALVIAPSISISAEDVTVYANNTNVAEQIEVSKEIKVEMTKNDDGVTKAVVTTVTTKNGESSTAYETFEGTEAEVKASISALKEDGRDLMVNTKKIVKEIEEEVVN